MSEEQNILDTKMNKENEPPHFPEDPHATIPSPENTPMEVHHHPDVEKKSFKEYLLEGLMIFLAVTMGFIAENIRENITDHEKEEEYVLSMIEDAKTDTMNIRIAIAQNKKRIVNMDSLEAYCFNYDGSENDRITMFRLIKRSFGHPDYAYPTERTLSQLKNSGGMRLIRKKAASDSIILYDDYAKKLTAQQFNYEQFQYEVANLSVQLFNFKYYRPQKDSVHQGKVPVAPSLPTLMNNDRAKLIEFGNRIYFSRGIVFFYIIRLQEMNEHAIHLIHTLQKEYHLENE
ncbi:MAG: hypothetical protein V4539_00875 [Bacteroidota bacterium]